MVQTRYQPISVQFRLARVGTYEEMHGLFIKVAKTEHAKIMAEDPKPGSFTRYVDGKKGAPEESVSIDGLIVYDYNRLDLVVQLAMETLHDKSPVLSGEYRNHHQIFLNGTPVPNLKGWKSGDDLIISNTVPYARKIEAGKMKMKVPGTDHVYAQAAQVVNRRYGNMAKTLFVYHEIGKDRFPALAIMEL